eukprot:CAMPEP_0184545732 /NCGR_PEP_ID=MMETSP0199_2-20130426/4502_1 /TAXON_ID=1112570 /ORGANISM="Thraustochytrium sp., Strain LLF1b" /LENGTH=76 /DNA_ID=CAMNT_0026940061 /DNA_START=365 /DNA_END=595 /DNA_ORIENTATION=+
MTAPPSFKRSTTVASYGDAKFSSIFDPAVVDHGCPSGSTILAQKLSFTATTIPSTKLSCEPLDHLSSDTLASSMAA